MFKPQNWLDRAFEIGIIGKGLNGVAELIGGTLLPFLTPDKIEVCLGHRLVTARPRPPVRSRTSGRS